MGFRSTGTKRILTLSGLRAFLCTMLLVAAAPALAPAALAGTVRVGSDNDLAAAFRAARPGDVITLQPGTYSVRKLKTETAGTESDRIVVRAETLGTVRIDGGGEAILIRHPYWTFENLEIRGACDKDDWCEHAFHIVGNASHTIIRNNIVREYNAMIKGNGLPDKKNGGMPYFPTDVVIEKNYLYNSSIRDTDNPVTPIDVMGGERWVVRDNFIADFAKSRGSGASYAAFLKGNSRDGVFERNLVVCEWRHAGGVRLGLSFGGGGTSLGSKTCVNQDCSVWHTNGIMRNNIVLNCPNDVGIYLSKASGAKVFNNTVYNANGIDVRFPQSSADIRNNLIAGAVRTRDQGTARTSTNVMTGSDFAAYWPALGRYMKKRLEGQDVKYPTIFAKADVDWAQSVVDDVIGYLEQSPIGNGSGKIDRLLEDPEALNFNLVDDDAILDDGQELNDVQDDFCERPRGATPYDVGAIEYSAGPCDVKARFPMLDELPREASPTG